MNIKDILTDNVSDSVPIYNNDYYIGIYKKTEKIACAVFLITDNKKDIEGAFDIVSDTRRAAKDALLSVIDGVSSPVEKAYMEIKHAVRMLVRLRSMLHLLVAAHVVKNDLMDVLVREIDLVIQNIYELEQKYRGQALAASTEYQPQYLEHQKVKKPSRILERSVGSVSLVSSQATSGGRRESILSIIRVRKVVSIKDISDAITDCSEKTIQRELLDMIADNIIVREGERRWSRYRLV